MKPRYGLAAAVVLAVAALALAQTSLWVSSTGAKLKADTKATAATVADVPVGAQLQVLEAKDTWYRVAAPDGKQGWIYRGKVSETSPAGSSGGGGGGLFGAVTSGSTIQAASADTSRSIRGLSPETTEYADAAGTPKENREALDKVLALKVDAADLEKFLQEGRIGEYAQ